MSLIAQYLPRTWEFLRNAGALDGQLGEAWSAVISRDCIGEHVLTNHDGTGEMIVSVAWPKGTREDLTEIFQQVLDACWSALDAMVEESVTRHSNRHRLSDPHAERFFPTAPSEEAMEELLSTGCLNGLPYELFEFVMAVQPFEPVTADHDPTGPLSRARHAFAWLCDWDSQVQEGQLLSAWATPVQPQLHVAPPVTVSELSAGAPGPVEPQAVVATYSLTGYSDGVDVHGQVGTYVDLALCQDFVPDDQDDTLSRRIGQLITGIATIALQFASRLSLDPGIEAVAQHDNEDLWVRADGPGSGWSPSELRSVTDSDLGFGVVTDRDQTTLIVDTGDGIYERVIPKASTLNPTLKRGHAAERSALAAAATWGVPDFVMRPQVEEKGSGVREISDGLLVVGDQGLILQSKAREAEMWADEAKEHRWAIKQATKATKQINGTLRRLSSSPISMVNGRGRNVQLSGATISWAGVVLIDHPAELDVELDELACKCAFVVLSRAEWEFLFDQLRSTASVVEYVHRVGAPGHKLGEEALRYYELADADGKAPPSELNPKVLGRGNRVSVPRLPKLPAGRDDPEGHAMIRTVCEEVALADWSSTNEIDRIMLLGVIDGLMPAQRSGVGRYLLDALSAARDFSGEGITTQARTILPTHGEPWLGFMIANRYDETIRNGVENWVMLRHSQRRDVTDWMSALTVGVLLTPRRDGYRPWDTTIIGVKGEATLDPDVEASALAVWGSPYDEAPT